MYCTPSLSLMYPAGMEKFCAVSSWLTVDMDSCPPTSVCSSMVLYASLIWARPSLDLGHGLLQLHVGLGHLGQTVHQRYQQVGRVALQLGAELAAFQILHQLFQVVREVFQLFQQLLQRLVRVAVVDDTAEAAFFSASMSFSSSLAAASAAAR